MPRSVDEDARRRTRRLGLLLAVGVILLFAFPILWKLARR
ncbi:MAG: hypothetical protein HMLKMBBP_02995 [Planctomycetes bacterium]|nr:hypothetical protein [Planctomycetota bacterium]